MGKTLPSLPTRIEMTEITQPGLFMETSEIIQPDPAHAYAALARHVAAIDIALKCGNHDRQLYVQELIRAEVQAAMEVIHRYENPFLRITPSRP
jgi:hypothetical protein